MDPFLGRTIGKRYLLTKPLGQGASGRVYRGKSLQLPRQFAIKIIDLDGQDPDARLRLKREVGAVSSLRNPHIVPFYEVVEIDEQYSAVVMDLVDGMTLERLIKDFGALPLRRGLQIARQIANGLHEAHTAGLVHRDLKPENIMVEMLPAGGDFVRLLDFGIVSSTTDTARVTRGFIGTPLYASPEQAMGGDIDQRSDIYSLGAIIFFMLTGSPPFNRESAMAALHDHVKKPPPTLSEVSEDTSFPEEVEVLVSQLLAKDPNLRPSNLGGLIRQLDIISGSDVSLGEISSEDMDSVAWFADEASEFNALPTSVAEVLVQYRRAILSPNQTSLVTIDSMNLLRWQEVDGEVRLEATMPGPVGGLCAGHDALLIGFESGTIVEMDIAGTSKVVYEVPKPHKVSSLSADAKMRTIVAGTSQGWIFTTRDRKSPRWDAYDMGAPVTAVACSAQGDVIAVGTKADVRVVNVASVHNPIWCYELANVNQLVFSNDGYVLAVLVGRSTVLLENAMSRHTLMEMQASGFNIRHIRFSENNELMAVVDTSDGLKTFKMEELVKATA